MGPREQNNRIICTIDVFSLVGTGGAGAVQGGVAPSVLA